jgi:fatty-acyl-CoA synthase
VIGIPDERWGELVTAVVVCDQTMAGKSDLIAHCRTVLAGYKCPKRIEFVDSLPRTATGKVQKFKIRALDCAALDVIHPNDLTLANP